MLKQVVRTRGLHFVVTLVYAADTILLLYRLVSVADKSLPTFPIFFVYFILYNKSRSDYVLPFSMTRML